MGRQRKYQTGQNGIGSGWRRLGCAMVVLAEPPSTSRGSGPAAFPGREEAQDENSGSGFATNRLERKRLRFSSSLPSLRTQ